MDEKKVRDIIDEITMAIREEIDTLHDKIDALSERVDVLEKKMDRRFDVIDEKFNVIDERFDTAIGHLDFIVEKLSDNDTEEASLLLDNHRKKIDNHEEGITGVEKIVAVA